MFKQCHMPHKNENNVLICLFCYPIACFSCVNHTLFRNQQFPLSVIMMKDFDISLDVNVASCFHCIVSVACSD